MSLSRRARGVGTLRLFSQMAGSGPDLQTRRWGTQVPHSQEIPCQTIPKLIGYNRAAACPRAGADIALERLRCAESAGWLGCIAGPVPSGHRRPHSSGSAPTWDGLAEN